MLTKTKQRLNISPNRKIRMDEGVKIWASFFRNNLNRFAVDYLGLNLHPFQHIILYLMQVNLFTTLITARGLSKSFTVAIFICCKAILYPNIKILISCATKSQSRALIKEKIEKELMSMSPNLRREIEEIKVGINETVVKFKNGSTIEAINASQNTRGYRAQVIVIDEYRMIEGGFQTLNTVIRPFLNVVRNLPFKKHDKFRDYPNEENQEVYISSAWFSEHWSYDHFKSYIVKMLEDKSYFTCNLPYQLALEHGLLTQARVDAMAQDENLNEIDFLMEFEAQFYRENDSAFIRSSDILPTRVLKNAWYPPNSVQFIEEKNKLKKNYSLQRLASNEIRILSGDIAMMSSTKHNNDASVFTLIRGIPKNEEYKKEVVYIETIEGEKADALALRMKQLFYDGECDYISLDTTGIGLSVFDSLTSYTYDQERDITYPPMTSFNDDKMAERCGYKDAVPVIFSIKATADLNHDIALTLKSAFQNRSLQLLVSDLEGKDHLIQNKNFSTKPIDEQTKMLMPYIQTSALQNEIINLESYLHRGHLVVKAKSNRRKDRYSSLCYGVYLFKQLEKDLKRPEKSGGGFVSFW